LTQAQNTYDIPKSTYFSTVDTSFLTGDSPVTLDINTTLGRNSVDGYILNDGVGDFTVNLSSDGTNFGNDIRIKDGESFDLRALDINSIKITWIANSSYRVFTT
jgi:hypothetical protein